MAANPSLSLVDYLEKKHGLNNHSSAQEKSMQDIEEQSNKVMSAIHNVPKLLEDLKKKYEEARELIQEMKLAPEHNTNYPTLEQFEAVRISLEQDKTAAKDKYSIADKSTVQEDDKKQQETDNAKDMAKQEPAYKQKTSVNTKQRVPVTPTLSFKKSATLVAELDTRKQEINEITSAIQTMMKMLKQKTDEYDRLCDTLTPDDNLEQ
jgi:hypothetical protein